MDDSRTTTLDKSKPAPPRRILWLCGLWLVTVIVSAAILGQWVRASAQVGWIFFWIAFGLGAGLMLAAIVLGARRHQGNLLIVLAVPVIATGAGHWGTPPAPIENVQRVASPSGTFEAIIGVSQTGVTHQPTVVFVTPRGTQPVLRRPLFVATRVEGLVVRWTADDQLSIHIAAGKTFTKDGAVSAGGRRVKIAYD